MDKAITLTVSLFAALFANVTKKYYSSKNGGLAGGLVLATVTAVIAFKERLTKKQWLGVVIGIISVVFLCNPFL